METFASALAVIGGVALAFSAIALIFSFLEACAKIDEIHEKLFPKDK